MSSSTEGVNVSFVEFESARYGQVVAHLDSENLNVADVTAEAKRLTETLDFVYVVTPSFDGESVILTLGLNEVDRYSGSYVNDQRRAALLTELAPKCTRKVTATAEVVRDRDTGKHRQTRITVSLNAGEAFTGLNVKQYDGSNGILRARTGSDARSIVFTMTEPASSDDEGKITAVIEALADKIGAMLVRPITVSDTNPNAALDPANDWSETVA